METKNFAKQVNEVFAETKQDAKQASSQKTTNNDQASLVAISDFATLREKALNDIFAKEEALKAYQFSRFISFTHDCIKFGVVSLSTAKNIKKLTNNYTLQFCRELPKDTKAVTTITNEKTKTVWYGYAADPKTCKNYITIYRSAIDAYSFAYNIKMKERNAKKTAEEKAKEKKEKEYSNIVATIKANATLSEEAKATLIAQMKQVYNL